MLENLKKILRGRHNSLKTKYYILPRDYILELLFLICGKKWIDFYKFRMDREARKAGSANAPIADKYLAGGKPQAAFILSHGLKPGEKLLDYGCGVLRLRLWLEGHQAIYCGVDISGQRIRQGLAMLEERGIDTRNDKIVVVNDYEMTGLDEKDFDFIWAASVYTHMPVDEIIMSMSQIKKIMSPTGKFIFTFSPAPGNEVIRSNQKDWFQPDRVIENCARKAGFDITILDRWEESGLGGKAAILTLPSNLAS